VGKLKLDVTQRTVLPHPKPKQFYPTLNPDVGAKLYITSFCKWPTCRDHSFIQSRRDSQASSKHTECIPNSSVCVILLHTYHLGHIFVQRPVQLSFGQVEISMDMWWTGKKWRSK